MRLHVPRMTGMILGIAIRFVQGCYVPRMTGMILSRLGWGAWIESVPRIVGDYPKGSSILTICPGYIGRFSSIAMLFVVGSYDIWMLQR